VARGPEGRFVHELVVPFVRRGAATTSRGAKDALPNGSPRQSLGAGRPRRRFPPGSEWLYAKLYTGPATVDRLLRDVIRPIIELASLTGAVDRWFFVRYADPDWHLRVRFHGEPVRLRDEVLPGLQSAAAAALDDGKAWRLQLDSYEREVERYGGARGIELAERIFHADSEAVLAMVEQRPEDHRGDARWRLALLSIDRLLEVLGLDLDARRAIARRARDTFASGSFAKAGFRRRVGEKFRSERPGLMALLDVGPATDPRLAPGLEVLRLRSEWLAPVLAELRSGVSAGGLTVPPAELAISYMHMHANRLLRSAHRAQEVILYDFLARLYESQAARAARGG
jgi:thiopeptide-type bacteriocin biosynthesis protein